MSLLRLTSRLTITTAAAARAQVHASSSTGRVGPLVALRAYSAVHNNDPDVLAREKARNLSGTQDSSAPHKSSAPGWNEYLATDSEASVKADHSGPAGKPDKAMQDATIDHTHKHHHTSAGSHGVEHHHAKHNPERTDSEDYVKADRDEH